MLCARGVRDLIILEQPGVVLAVHQNDFSRLTCIGYRISGVHAVPSCTKHDV